MHSSPRRILQVLACLGPVFSSGGLRNWHLHLCADEVVAVPLGAWASIRAGLLAGMGRSPDDAYAPPPPGDALSLLRDEGSDRWRRYRRTGIEYVLVKRSVGANEIRVKPFGRGPDVYGIGHRAHTDFCRTALRQLYGSLYRDEGFRPFWRSNER